ncbi:MAG: DUF2797 domain-containing protein [Tenuifilum sp.]|uniref:DUF2797 domain-containing protein n=1 Tax=Tenuifilum sp. TaxID=2760880 RepID=UPI0030A2D0CF
MKGVLTKMGFTNTGNDVSISPEYFLDLDSGRINLSELIGKGIGLKYLNINRCIHCGRETKKLFGQGFCYPCFIKVPEAEECVLRPELCRAHEGIARDLEFAKANCLVQHYVYLAWTGGLKVGVTRYHQIPTRWVDQGATFAVKICHTPNRYTAGLVEVELKKIFADKTAWQRMLTDSSELPSDFLTSKAKALEFINGKNLSYIPESDVVYRVSYPVIQLSDKVRSVNLEKVNAIEGKLVGIKGQYLIFESGIVINIRNHSGYLVDITF